MQLVIKEIMDLSVRKNGVVLKNPVPVGTSQIPGEKSSVVKRGAKLSFSVDRLLKSPEQKQNNTQDKPVKDEIDSSSILPALSSACLTPPLPIRPLVSHPPPMPGSISLLQSLYVPTMYTHQGTQNFHKVFVPQLIVVTQAHVTEVNFNQPKS